MRRIGRQQLEHYADQIEMTGGVRVRGGRRCGGGIVVYDVTGNISDTALEEISARIDCRRSQRGQGKLIIQHR